MFMNHQLVQWWYSCVQCSITSSEIRLHWMNSIFGELGIHIYHAIWSLMINKIFIDLNFISFRVIDNWAESSRPCTIFRISQYLCLICFLFSRFYFWLGSLFDSGRFRFGVFFSQWRIQEAKVAINPRIEYS